MSPELMNMDKELFDDLVTAFSLRKKMDVLWDICLETCIQLKADKRICRKEHPVLKLRNYMLFRIKDPTESVRACSDMQNMQFWNARLFKKIEA